jgi:hypothetical protein
MEAGFVKAKLDEAWDFLGAAMEEFAKAGGDPVRVRDAAEKGWNAVVQATDALIHALAGVRPMSHYERRVALRDLERRRDDVRDLGLRDRYMARYKILHGEAFYEGVIDPEEIILEFERVKEYIEAIEKLVK